MEAAIELQSLNAPDTSETGRSGRDLSPSQAFEGSSRREEKLAE